MVDPILNRSGPSRSGCILQHRIKLAGGGGVPRVRWYGQSRSKTLPLCLAGRRAAPDAGRRQELYGQPRSRGPSGSWSRVGSTGGREGSGGLGTRLSRSEVPSPGRWIRSGRKPQSSVLHDCASLDWSTGPYPTRSGSDPIRQRLTRRLRTEARPRRLDHAHEGLTRPVTEDVV